MQRVRSWLARHQLLAGVVVVLVLSVVVGVGQSSAAGITVAMPTIGASGAVYDPSSGFNSLGSTIGVIGGSLVGVTLVGSAAMITVHGSRRARGAF